jgi:hypothetical protein
MRSRCARGQATVELIASAIVLTLAALALFQVLAAGRTAAIAQGAAEAAAVAVVNGRDPEAAARAAAPDWPRDRIRVRERAGRVTVTLAAPAALRSLRAPLRVSAEAFVRRPARGG